MNLLFELTNRCNLNCNHCLRDPGERTSDLSLDLIDRVLGQAKDHYNISEASFTGGEPLMHKHFDGVTDLLAARGFKFSLVTNGHLIPKRLERLCRPEVKALINHVAVSLEGPDEEAHNAIRGPGAYKKTMAGILALKASGIPVVIKQVVGRHNIDSIERSILNIVHLEPKHAELCFLLPTPDNTAAELVASPAQYQKAHQEINRLSSELKTPVYMAAGFRVDQSFYSCYAISMRELYIDAKGRLCFCCMLAGLRGSDPSGGEADVVSDLYKENLWDAHKKLVDMIAKFQKDRLGRIGKNDLAETDHFMCLACARYFGKMDWLDKFDGNPWQLVPPGEGGSK